MCVAQRGQRLEKRPYTEARLAGWRKMIQQWEICLMMDASEGRPVQISRAHIGLTCYRKQTPAAGHARQIFSYKWGAAGWGE
jgi:hypothetical protein